jgi:hypothetical protein
MLIMRQTRRGFNLPDHVSANKEGEDKKIFISVSNAEIQEFLYLDYLIVLAYVKINSYDFFKILPPIASKGSTVALPFHKRLAIKTIDHSAQTKPGLAELRCRPSWLSLSDATQSTNLAWPRCYVGLAGFGQSTRQNVS